MAAITVGQFEITEQPKNDTTIWYLTQSGLIQAEGSLDYVLDIMFDRMNQLAKRDLKKVAEQGGKTIKHTITMR